jgi:hypothetical protein
VIIVANIFMGGATIIHKKIHLPLIKYIALFSPLIGNAYIKIRMLAIVDMVVFWVVLQKV